jgi:hypothetical protein
MLFMDMSTLSDDTLLEVGCAVESGAWAREWLWIFMILMSSMLLYWEELGRRVLPQVDVEFGKSHNTKQAVQLLPVATSCRLGPSTTYAEFLLHGTGFLFIKPWGSLMLRRILKVITTAFFNLTETQPLPRMSRGGGGATPDITQDTLEHESC